ncbi:TRAF3 interacting protein 1, transcript variant X1 [Ictidomys tridecemlineatus]|uniref:TRAF3-interacting protein 1 isoform X4 n=1 Tax=Ictidomys tridecemlineatus TaxID=43179 RepID=UPI00068089C7|nr:TRAF3-interacting protein 1 isoform X4 [Ictidomys tridecemlineatus]KAG3275655.1 TRAF3 interacting protein 1, transcript variant X1 [Ictidomys tridecemlineatus]
MNAAVVRRTQEALGKVIRRPPLTEKLLSKPPFRYLHDIVTEVIRTTGFMKGLYTDVEMKSDNVKDKDAKISFLQKAIDVVMMVSGEPLLAKPARIVAGHEPERTNELLQIIAKCCINKLSSEDAVRRVLAGEKADARGRASRTSKPHESDNKNVREDDSRAHRDREDRRNSEVKERSTSRDGKQREELKEESKSREKERDKEKMKDNDRDRHKDVERDKYREGEKEKSRSRARQERERDRDRGNKDRDADRDKERERRGEAGREKERHRERDRDKGKDRERRRARNGEHSRDPDREKNREQEKLERKSASSGEISKKFSDGSFKDSKAETEAEISTTASRSLTSKTSKRRSKTSVEGTKETITNSTSVSDDNSTTLWRESVEPDPAVKQKGDSISDAEGDTGATGQDKSEVCENPEAPSELSSNVRRIPRPGSARPAPPRVKRQEGVETLMMDRTGSGKTVSNVIIDSQNSDNEDDDQFVVEAAPQISEMSEIETVPALELEDSEKHGGLVKKILETKKDYEKLQQSPKPGEKEKSFVFESAWKKEKDIVSKEIEKLRVSIQTLCKSALPLGKIMDYIQEDVDAMQNELQLWHTENKQHAEALQKEQSITDCAVEPLKVELAELEQMIKDQQDKICAVKANILKNEEKIQKMVYSINLTSRR